MKRLLIASTFLLAAAALPVALGTPEARTGTTISPDPTLYAEGENNGFGTKNFAEGESNGFGATNYAMAGVEHPVFHFGPLMPEQWLD